MAGALTQAITAAAANARSAVVDFILFLTKKIDPEGPDQLTLICDFNEAIAVPNYKFPLISMTCNH
jgi:hypothetical protein